MGQRPKSSSGNCILIDIINIIDIGSRSRNSDLRGKEYICIFTAATKGVYNAIPAILHNR